MTAKPAETPPSGGEDLMQVLEDGVKAVVRNKKSTASERNAAMSVGVKLLLVRYRISGDETKGFFD
jgi:hypothetical protein